MEKIKIAFIKFCGLSSGGTEKGLQTIAANLPKDQFEVDFYYCDSAPYVGADYIHAGTDQSRYEYLKNAGVNLIEFKVGFKNIKVPTHDWVNTDFWDIFDEKKYDIVQTARAGHPEYPFTQINQTPIVDLITLPGMADKKFNVVKSIHISQYQADTWVEAGGKRSLVEVIPLVTEIKDVPTTNLREELSIPEDHFVFGMHQRKDNGIFSPVPLAAFSEVEDEKCHFVLLGGSDHYEQQANQLALYNFHRIEHTGDYDRIHKFLNTLNVYAHGRADGETYSMAIAEALSHGLPVISHVAKAMGHVETINDAGFVVESLLSYSEKMRMLMTNKNVYDSLSENALKQYNNRLSLEVNIERFVKIYNEVYEKYSKTNHFYHDSGCDDDWLNDWVVD